MAPGQVPTPQSLLTEQALRAASDDELAHTAAAVLAEQHRRALEDKDMPAVLEEAFVLGFASNGQPNVPWIADGLLFCPGWIRFKSATSHECSFASSDGKWVWEHEAQIEDEMRQVPGPKVVKQSITVLTVHEGLELDVVASASRSGGPCQMKKVVSYQVRGGELVPVSTRARAPQGHSRG